MINLSAQKSLGREPEKGGTGRKKKEREKKEKEYEVQKAPWGIKLYHTGRIYRG